MEFVEKLSDSAFVGSEEHKFYCLKCQEVSTRKRIYIFSGSNHQEQYQNFKCKACGCSLESDWDVHKCSKCGHYERKNTIL